MGHGSSGSSGRGDGKAASPRDGANLALVRRWFGANVGFVSRRRRAPPRSHRSASSSSMSTNDTCHTIGLDLGTLSTLVITKRMCAQISGASRVDVDAEPDGAPPASLRASARSLEVFAAAGPARRPPPHEHVCAAPSERTNGARPPRSCTANDVGPFLATSIMDGSRRASSSASFAEASDASRALASISATRAPGLGRHGASRCDACDIPTTTRARE
mmetsp:Transcript_1389/g.6033  ORF Transcript_1389/g.6033 Transcript_1389/m.6033 type:complete len:218 (+) Transcript_1389:421-1074(+)